MKELKYRVFDELTGKMWYTHPKRYGRLEKIKKIENFLIKNYDLSGKRMSEYKKLLIDYNNTPYDGLKINSISIDEYGVSFDFPNNNLFREYTKIHLMQYIGLEDKNSIEIYERDIISDNIGIGVVEYSNKYAAFRVNYKNGQCKWFYDYLDSEIKCLEVIGNKDENFELLKEIKYVKQKK